MLLIKRSQLDQIKKVRREAYLTHFVRLLREEGLVDAATADAAVKSKINVYYLEAKKFNLFAEKNINVFVYASFALGARFYEEDESLKKVLSDFEVTEDERAAILEAAAESAAAKISAE